MKFMDIVYFLKCGNKVRRRGWSSDFFIWYESSDFWCESKKKGKVKEFYPFCMTDFLSADWQPFTDDLESPCVVCQKYEEVESGMCAGCLHDAITNFKLKHSQNHAKSSGEKRE